MAIQGIIRGFANPGDLAKNVVLVGRGAQYVLLVDGNPQEPAHLDLEAACRAFDTKAVDNCAPNWLEVAELESTNVNGQSKVVGTRSTTFAQCQPVS